MCQQENHTQKYFEWWEAKKPNGLPFKRDHKNRTLNFAYSKLGIPKNLIRTEHQRGIYFSPLYNNTNEFLRKEIGETDLVKSFDTSEETLSNIWKTKYAKGRISMLKKKNNVSYESLFYDDLVDATTLALMRFRQGGFLRLPSDEPEEIQWFKSHRRERFYTV